MGDSQPAPATPPRPPEIEVAAGLLFRAGRILIAQRRPGDHLGGLWEFPGGKRHPGESFETCLQRELREELGVEVEVLELVEALTYAYPEKIVHLRFHRCRWVRHEPQALGCQAWAWAARSDLARYAFPPADQPLVQRLAAEPSWWEQG